MNNQKYKTEIINGFEITSYEEEQLTENKDKVMTWLKDNLILTKSINKKSSYRLKHVIEKEIGDYVSNYDVKYCMAMLNIRGVTMQSKINYFYPISDKMFK